MGNGTPSGKPSGLRRVAGSLATLVLLLARVVCFVSLAILIASWTAINAPTPKLGCVRDAARQAGNSSAPGLKVILPAAGSTGTTSVVVALNEMGLKTYHCTDSATHMPETMYWGVRSERFADWVDSCGLDGLAIEPLTDVFPLVNELYPEAKVILTVRDFERWRASVRKAGKKDSLWILVTSLLSANTVPYFPVLDLLSGGHFSRALAEGRPITYDTSITMMFIWHTWSRWQLIYVTEQPMGPRFRRGTFIMGLQRDKYEEHLEVVRRLVPPERLLEFRIDEGDGYEKLERFLGLPAPRAPFPHPRMKTSWTNDAMCEPRPLKFTVVLLVWFAAARLNWQLLDWMLKRAPWWARLMSAPCAWYAMCAYCSARVCEVA